MLKIPLIIISIVFIFSISDLRKKTGARFLLRPFIVYSAKACYPIPLAALLWAIWQLPAIDIIYVIAAGLIVLGTYLALSAKIALGSLHTWAGHGQEQKQKIITSGPYRIMRHPMYVGIWLYMLGGMVIIARASLGVGFIYLVACMYIAIFLRFAAKREEHLLLSRDNSAYASYMQRVRPWSPFHRN